MFRVGTIGSKDIDWGDVFTICDLKIVALATTAADPTKVYGDRAEARRGQEAHRRRPLPDRPGDARGRDAARPRRRRRSTPSATCRLAPNGEAWATEARGRAGATKYNAVRRIANVAAGGGDRDDRPARGPVGPGRHRRRSGTRTARRRHGLRRRRDTGGTKLLSATTARPRSRGIPLETTALRLEPYPPTGMLLVTSEDGFAVRLVDMRAHAKVDELRADAARADRDRVRPGTGPRPRPQLPRAAAHGRGRRKLFAPPRQVPGRRSSPRTGRRR